MGGICRGFENISVVEISRDSVVDTIYGRRLNDAIKHGATPPFVLAM
jgi:hypothetical protein